MCSRFLRRLAKALGWVAALVLFGYPGVYVRTTQPQMTETEVFLRFWPWYLVGLLVLTAVVWLTATEDR